MTKFTRELKNELVTEVELDTGIRTGYVSGFAYTDDKGNKRNKFQTLSTLSSSSIKKTNTIPTIPADIDKPIEEPVEN